MGLDHPQYAILLSGKWGSGKTHFIEQFKNEHSNIRVVKISLFGLKSKEDIHKKIVLEQFTFPKASEAIAKNLNNVFEKFTGLNLNISLSDISVESAIKQVKTKKTVFIFDDLERMEMSFPEAFGYINQLVENYEQKVVFLADDTQLKDREEYQQFKEKIIGKTFQIGQNFDIAFNTFISELKNSKEILQNNQSNIKSVFDTAGYQNLRSLRQGILDFDRLINSFEDKFKNHSELMTEFIQVFFALLFEIKSSSLDIQLLHKIIELKAGKLQEEERNNVLNEIKRISKKYNFLFEELFLSNQNWIDFFTKGSVPATEISLDLDRSRYFFREQKEEWVILWHYMWIEEDEFQNALEQTLLKLESNDYLKPSVILHVAGILLEIIDQKIYSYRKDQIVDDIKKYIDANIKKLEDLYILDTNDLEGHYTGFSYRSEESDEFNYIKDYLLKQADNLRNEGLEEKGNFIIQCLSENNIQEFTNMLSAERNKEILYRLPVLSAINPQDFFDALLHVENKYMRDVFDVLKNRYRSITAYEKEIVLEEFDFWKEVSIIANKYQVKVPYEIKDVWIKKYFCDLVEKEIIQKIEKEIKSQENTDQLEVTTNEQSNN